MIPRGDCATFVVTAQIDFNHIPRVRPIGVMILFLCQTSNLGHKTKGFYEIGKLKLAVQRIVLFNPTRGHEQLFCHFRIGGIAVTLKFVGKFWAATLHNATLGQNVYEIGLQFFKQSAVMRND